MEFTHAGPKDAAREAELSAPSGVVCSDFVSRFFVCNAHALKVSNGRIAATSMMPNKNAPATATVPANINTGLAVVGGRRLRMTAKTNHGIGTKNHHIGCPKNKSVNIGGLRAVSANDRMTKYASNRPTQHSIARAKVNNHRKTRMVFDDG